MQISNSLLLEMHLFFWKTSWEFLWSFKSVINMCYFHSRYSGLHSEVLEMSKVSGINISGSSVIDVMIK